MKRPFTKAVAEYLLALAWSDCTSPECDCSTAADPDVWYEAMRVLLAERGPA